jgi:hypothetical protein
LSWTAFRAGSATNSRTGDEEGGAQILLAALAAIPLPSAVQDVVLALPSNEMIASSLATERVGILIAAQGVSASVTPEQVPSLSSANQIAARPPFDDVIATPPTDNVLAGCAYEFVIALITGHRHALSKAD